MVTIRMQRSVNATSHDEIILLDIDQINARGRIWQNMCTLWYLIDAPSLINFSNFFQPRYSYSPSLGFLMISGIIEVDLIHLIVHLISKAKFGDGLLET